MSNFVELAQRNGELLTVDGNQTLRLNDPDRIWIVCSGLIDVFTVPVTQTERPQARIHLCRVQPGQLLCGVDCESRQLPQLMAVGLPGSEVAQISGPQLNELLRNAQAEGTGELREKFAQLLEHWIETLTAAILLEKEPHDALLLNIGTQQAVQAGRTVSPRHGVAWINESDGEVAFLKQPLTASDLAAGPFPLSASGWLTVTRKTKLTTVSTLSLLDDPLFWPGLQAFHQRIFSVAALNARQSAVASQQRLAEKVRAERRLAESALSRLAAAVSAEDDLLPDQASDPLLAACRLVGERLGITVRTPRNYAEQDWNDPVDVIARASGVRYRRVALSANWWSQDNGPLLGFLAESGQAVALLPRSASRYELVNPDSGNATPVTAAVAASLRPFGYTFYRSFPSEPLTPGEVFRFGLKGTGRDWLVLGLMGLAASLIGLLIPITTGWVIGKVIPAADQSQLLLMALGLTVAAVVLVLLQFVQGVAMLRIETRMDNAVEAAVWDRLLNIPASFFRGYTAGDLAMRAMGISYIRQALTQSASSSILTFFASMIYFGLLAYYDGNLALLAAGLFALIVGATCVTVYFQLPCERELQNHRGRLWGIVLQLFTGVSRLRVAGAEERALAYWAHHYSLQTRASIRSQLISNNLGAFLAMLPVLAPLVIFASVSLSPAGTLSVPAFLAFYAAFSVLMMSAMSMGGTISSILNVVPLFERARPILETRPEYDSGKRNPGRLNGEIEISHVSFRYHPDGPLILNDVSLHIQPGEYVAFVGPSGAGKSTILRLLLGFETPESGAIYYGREDLSGLDQLAVRRQIGVVLQEGKLVPGDILRNITGSAPLTLEDAWEAARLSGFDEDIKKMPMGMYTFLSDGESTLSGGQRQRLMIARAIVKKPRFLLFDEATSALDNVTQAKVAQSLDNLKATRVVIAHRLSTVINADRICVVEQGRIVQQGTYQELVEQPGLFADLARRQLL